VTAPDHASSLFASPRHGPLPALLLVLTVATGLVDAVSILALGRVFVANMTGNVVFIGFALAGAPGFSLAAALVALAGFLVGAGLAGPVIGRLRQHRGRVLAAVTTAEVAPPRGTRSPGWPRSRSACRTPPPASSPSPMGRRRC
jgi:hypothetical protein